VSSRVRLVVEQAALSAPPHLMLDPGWVTRHHAISVISWRLVGASQLQAAISVAGHF
jgi:hypothetical protein